MKLFQRYLVAAAVVLGLPWLAAPARGQTLPLQIDQTAMLVKTNFALGINWQSYRGVPLSSTVGVPPGSDGRAPTIQQQSTNGGVTTLPASSNQFSGFVGVSGIPVQGSTVFNTNASFAANVISLNWPRGTADNTANGQVVAILRSAQVGAPYFAQQVSYYFGAVIPVPLTDENGVTLTNIDPLVYWLPQPYTTNNYTNAPYYWSPNANAVFAIQAGGIDITWKKAAPTNGVPSDYLVNSNKYVVQNGYYYTLYPVHYIVSGAAVKPAQKMYWTEGSYAQTGHPISVPQDRVSAINFVYNNAFPQYAVPGDTTTVIPVTNTIWFDTSSPQQIRADNVQGRIFAELLGELNNGGPTRRFLGFEIIDVTKEPAPTDVTVNLGDRVPAYQDARDDSNLDPSPIQNLSQSFYYQQNNINAGLTTLYATHETVNLNDFEVHWLIPGVAGLGWPYIFDRYHEVWPSDPAQYVNYLRPATTTSAQAALTAVRLPAAEAPSIPYQDPLDQPRAFLTPNGLFYTMLDAAHPAHRTLLQFNQGANVAYERVFSWLDLGVKSNGLFAGTLATNLTAWNPTNASFSFGSLFNEPYVVTNTVYVGNRIAPPSGELGSFGSYWAGYIVQSNGNSFNPGAYRDPFAVGFDQANQGAIIPVNAIPGHNSLEVWWFRSDNADGSLGFQSSFWPAVIGHYTLQWPSGTSEIIMANNAGSGALDSLQAKGTIYRQNDPTLPGYNPNEEHALMLGGQAYSLCDDLNVTNVVGYTSDPFVLINYTGSDGRPSMTLFHVRREAPELGYLFDYVVNAGTILQAPMPLPLLDQPVEGAGAYATNYNTAPLGTTGDLPVGWSSSLSNSPFGLYAGFTYQDRKHEFWVYRGLNAGLPPLQIGQYDPTNNVFKPLPAATAVVNLPFGYYIHCSRVISSVGINVSPSLPSGLSTAVTPYGFAITGTPTAVSSNLYTLTVEDTGDQSSNSMTLSINITTNGFPFGLQPLVLTSTNQYSGANATYLTRPPFLAQAPGASNSFTMQFYYKNQASFDWPRVAAPVVGGIVPYLRARDGSGNFVGDPTAKTTPSLNIVYRPVWPSLVNGQPLPTLYAGLTLTEPNLNLPAVRGQSSVQALYQQYIATNNIGLGFSNRSVVLYDPTVQKTSSLPAQGLTALPAGVVSRSYQAKYYFPNLPPNLVNEVYFDPNTTNLVFQGQFNDDIVGEKWLQPNILAGADLAAVIGLCPAADPNYAAWVSVVTNLATPVFTFHEAPGIPGSYVVDPSKTVTNYASDLVEITSPEQAVDSYALSATGPGMGYVTLLMGNTINPVHASEPVSVYIIRVAPPLWKGQLKIIQDPNPLSESISFQHTLDLAGHSSDYLYDWRIAPPVDGLPPTTDPTNWTTLTAGNGITHFTLGGSAGIQTLGDNYIVVRYRDTSPLANPATTNWSTWTDPALASGWIKRVLGGINPFQQRTTDLFDNSISTTASIISQAGHRWEGDVALNAQTITNAGLIEIYETVLHRGEAISINAGYNYGPANDALLLAASYLNDLYMYVANDAWADEANPTIGIGTDNATFGNIATALFSFKGEVPSLLEENLALLRGRNDTLSPGVTLAPVYNRLYWNYTKGIADGEVIYALNYNIQDQNGDGVVDASDAAAQFPMGHGDAYGHYLTALCNYYSLLMNPNFDWVPRIEAVSVLGATVSVNYQDERKFAAAAAALARTGEQIFGLTWRQKYQPGTSAGWNAFGVGGEIPSAHTYDDFGTPTNVVGYWGLDHWASRVDAGAYLNWVVGNAILPPVDPDPSHQGIQKVDRTTVPELQELPLTAAQLQADMDNAEAGFTPLNLPQNAIPFDINPLQVTGPTPMTHFEQIYQRAVGALNNAVVAFNDAQNVTETMRSQQNSLSDFQAGVTSQELAYNNQLIELYGTPYPDDVGPGKTYAQGYSGPDLIHYTYVDNPDNNTFGGILPDPTQPQTVFLDIQQLPADWSTTMYTNFNFIMESTAPGYAGSSNTVAFNIGPDGFFDKPANWSSTRGSPGAIQQAISALLAAQNQLRADVDNAVSDKQGLDKAMNAFTAQQQFEQYTTGLGNTNTALQQDIASIAESYAIANQWETVGSTFAQDVATTLSISIPTTFIAGLADGGDVARPAAGVVYAVALAAKWALLIAGAGQFTAMQVDTLNDQTIINANSQAIASATFDNDMKNAILNLGAQEGSLQNDLATINTQLRSVSDAQAAYQALVAKGNRIQTERLSFRQHAAAIIQGYRTRDAAFLLFENEKLERYQTLFNLAAEYSYLAAQAYDYETGLLNTDAGRAFLNKIISSCALGVVENGVPQYAGSDTGDPGLSSALAEMNADWQVLKGRLGFNNPDGYGTTVSLRSENYRILPTTDGDNGWQQVLQQGLVPNLLQDPDVVRNCLQIDDGSGLPVPGIVLTFGTTIANGLNLFGNQLAPGDHTYSSSSFATKIFAVGVDFDGYVGMDNPTAGGGSIPAAPTSDPNALAATPYIYLIPVGVDSMRSPPLGDASTIRTWNVDDLTIPLPFNVSASQFSSSPFYNASSSLTEPLFSVRKHQAFRPVSSTAAFDTSIYGAVGALQPSEFTNKRLIGRSIWNSKWKMIIPGRALLADPNQGLARFINSVKDVKLYFITYSYAGN